MNELTFRFINRIFKEFHFSLINTESFLVGYSIAERLSSLAIKADPELKLPGNNNLGKTVRFVLPNPSTYAPALSIDSSDFKHIVRQFGIYDSSSKSIITEIDYSKIDYDLLLKQIDDLSKRFISIAGLCSSNIREIPNHEIWMNAIEKRYLIEQKIHNDGRYITVKKNSPHNIITDIMLQHGIIFLPEIEQDRIKLYISSDDEIRLRAILSPLRKDNVIYQEILGLIQGDVTSDDRKTCEDYNDINDEFP